MTGGEAEELRRALAAAGHAWPAPIEHHERVESTNDLLKERARAGTPEWTVVLATEQTGGRGRQGRRWASPPGNLYLSVLLLPHLPLASLLPLAAGLAVAEGLAPFGVAGLLKWPNDVLAGGRKLAGVLAEASSGPAGLDWVVLGIGVNLNAEVPAELAGRATSVRECAGRVVDAIQVATSVLPRLTVCYHALKEAGSASLIDAWRARSIPWWGRPVEARSGGQVIRGVARDVDERGALVLDGRDGERMTVLSGDVEELRLAPVETCS